MRLFVDVDETLILWPLGEMGKVVIIKDEPPKPNHDVLEFVRRWVKYNPTGDVIVWSLGGLEYAAGWKNKLGISFAVAWSKEPIAVERGDLFIDDDPLPFYRERNIHPDLLRGLG